MVELAIAVILAEVLLGVLLGRLVALGLGPDREEEILEQEALDQARQRAGAIPCPRISGETPPSPNSRT